MSVLVELPEVEVSAKAQRRRFTAEYKRRILQEANDCTKTGELAALLRREGLYSSHLTTWRRQRERGELVGPRAEEARPESAARRRARSSHRRAGARHGRLQARLEKAEIIIEVQKKVGRLLGIEMPETPLSTVKR